MKRTLVLVAILMTGLALVSVSAQDITLQAGGKTGLNFGWISGSDWKDSVDALDGNNGVGVGFTLGGFVEIGITEQFAAQPELLFFGQKGKISGEILGEDYTAVTTLNSLQLPILAKGLFPVGEGVAYGLAGPSVFLIVGDGKVKVEVNGDETTQDVDPDKRLLFGLALGGGYEYPLGPGSLIGELRYTRVLSRYEDDFDAFGNTVSLLVGYGIPIE